MDEKLRKSLTAIICDIVECTEPLDCDMASTCPYVNDGLPQIEQAFREAGLLEPQQPEGGLVPNPRPDNLSEVELKFPDFDQGILIGAQDGFAKGSKAQRAFDLATMVKLPSEDDIRGILQTAVWDGGFVTLDTVKPLALMRFDCWMVNEDELVSAFLKLLQEQKP